MTGITRDMRTHEAEFRAQLDGLSEPPESQLAAPLYVAKSLSFKLGGVHSRPGCKRWSLITAPNRNMQDIMLRNPKLEGKKDLTPKGSGPGGI